MDYLLYGAGLIGVIIVFCIITKRWFWLMFFGLGAFASLLATLYFFAHSQMQPAVGCIVLTAALGMFYLRMWDAR